MRHNNYTVAKEVKIFVIMFITIYILSFLSSKPLRITASNDACPAIFYVPHADDEAIGMAAAIAEHKEAGREVYIVLVSSEQNQGLLDIMNGKSPCPLAGKSGWKGHPKYHNHNMTNEELNQYRIDEFTRSALSMGADKVFIAREGQCISDELFYTNYDEAKDQVKEIIKDIEGLYPGASHKLVSGARDKIYYNGEWVVNTTHMALYEAAVEFNKENPQVTDFSFYRIYIYRNPSGNQEIDKPDYIFENKPQWQLKKQEALNVYKTYNPQHGLYALGYHSFPDLIDSAYINKYTYVDFLPNSSEP